jgi:hypothetical protein
MESLGAVETVLGIWNTCSNTYVATIATDEDYTTRSKLLHSIMADLVVAGRMAEAEEQTKGGEVGFGPKNNGHGMLPLDHQAIKKLSGPIHYV